MGLTSYDRRQFVFKTEGKLTVRKFREIADKMLDMKIPDDAAIAQLGNLGHSEESDFFFIFQEKDKDNDNEG